MSVASYTRLAVRWKRFVLSLSRFDHNRVMCFVVSILQVGLGSLYWALLFPADVIKSKMQSDAVLKSDRKYKSIMQSVGSLYKEGGVSCFYRGFLPCMLRSTPANGIMLMTVDKVRNYIEAL